MDTRNGTVSILKRTVANGAKRLSLKAIAYIKKENSHCWECKAARPDEIYFNSDSGEVLSVICTACREAFEATIKSIGKAYCTDPDCVSCE